MSTFLKRWGGGGTAPPPASYASDIIAYKYHSSPLIWLSDGSQTPRVANCHSIATPVKDSINFMILLVYVGMEELRSSNELVLVVAVISTVVVFLVISILISLLDLRVVTTSGVKSAKNHLKRRKIILYQLQANQMQHLFMIM